MKANEAPTKIYVSNYSSGLTYNWHKWLAVNDIEYTRTDAFIDKACEWLKENGGSYWMDDYDLPTDDLVNDFRKYMKGL